jgi:hypothetical protein
MSDCMADSACCHPQHLQNRRGRRAFQSGGA